MGHLRGGCGLVLLCFIGVASAVDVSTEEALREAVSSGANKEVTIIADIALNGTDPIPVPGIVTVSSQCGLSGIDRCGVSLYHANSRLFTVLDNGFLTLRHVHIYGGDTGTGLTDATSAAKGGAILVNPGGSIHVDGVILENNTATDGGAVYLNNAVSATFTDSEIRNNVAYGKFLEDRGHGGGIVAWDTDVAISGVTFYGNTARQYGGALSLKHFSKATVTGTAFSSNTATDKDGGALYTEDGTTGLSLTSTIFADNSAGRNGGGVLYSDHPQLLPVSLCSFQRNHAGQNGGGIYITLARMTTDFTNFVGNSATGNGGAVYHNQFAISNSALPFTNCNFESNRAANGGALFGGPSRAQFEFTGIFFNLNRATNGNGGVLSLTGAQSKVSIYSTSVLENYATGSGAGVYAVAGADVGIYQSTFQSNVAGEFAFGGAVFVDGLNSQAAIYDSYLQFNRGGTGGALSVSNLAMATVTRSYIDDNTANDSGGAVAVRGQGTVFLDTVQLNYNFARASGGALAVRSGSRLVVDGCNMFRNSASQGSSGTVVVDYTKGGALSVASGGLLKAYTFIRNSVLRENQADHGGGVHSEDNNHVVAEHTLFISNLGQVDGGAVYLVELGSNIFKDCNFTVNIAAGAIEGGKGGAVVMEGNDAMAHFERCKFERNQAAFTGGALYVNSTANIASSEFLGNSCSGSNGTYYTCVADVDIQGGGPYFIDGMDSIQLINETAVDFGYCWPITCSHAFLTQVYSMCPFSLVPDEACGSAHQYIMMTQTLALGDYLSGPDQCGESISCETPSLTSTTCGSACPTAAPTPAPTMAPTAAPTPGPTLDPNATAAPAALPTAAPTPAPVAPTPTPTPTPLAPPPTPTPTPAITAAPTPTFTLGPTYEEGNSTLWRFRSTAGSSFNGGFYQQFGLYLFDIIGVEAYDTFYCEGAPMADAWVYLGTAPGATPWELDNSTFALPDTPTSTPEPSSTFMTTPTGPPISASGGTMSPTGTPTATPEATNATLPEPHSGLAPISNCLYGLDKTEEETCRFFTYEPPEGGSEVWFELPRPSELLCLKFQTPDLVDSTKRFPREGVLELSPDGLGNIWETVAVFELIDQDALTVKQLSIRAPNPPPAPRPPPSPPPPPNPPPNPPPRPPPSPPPPPPMPLTVAMARPGDDEPTALAKSWPAWFGWTAAAGFPLTDYLAELDLMKGNSEDAEDPAVSVFKLGIVPLTSLMLINTIPGGITPGSDYFVQLQVNSPPDFEGNRQMLETHVSANFTIVDVSEEPLGGITAALTYELELTEDPSDFLQALQSDLQLALRTGPDRFTVFGYSPGSVVAQILFLPSSNSPEDGYVSSEGLARLLDAQANDPESILRTQGALGEYLAPGGAGLNLPPLPTITPVPEEVLPAMSLRDEVIIFAAVAVAVELMVALVCWAINTVARKIQLSTVSRATGTPLDGAKPFQADDDNERALVVAGEVQSLGLPPGTAILVGPPPRYDTIFSALVSVIQFVAFIVYTTLVLAERTDTLAPHLITAVAVLVLCFICNTLGLIISLVGAQAVLDDWQRMAFTKWYKQRKLLVTAVMLLGPVTGCGLDSFVMLGSHTIRAFAAPWAQETYTRLLGWSVVIGLFIQSVPQVALIIVAAIMDDTSWVLTSKASLLLSLIGLVHNLGGKLVMFAGEIIQGGTRVNPRSDVVGDGLAGVEEPEKYDNPDKDIVAQQDGSYVADEFTPEHYVCPLSGMVMQNPVTFSDGYTYDKAALEHYLEQHGGVAVSPLTGAKLDNTKFVPNMGVAMAIKAYLQRVDRPLTKFVITQPTVRNEALLPPKGGPESPAPAIDGAPSPMPGDTDARPSV